ncbi:hypothetical protein [Bacillus sp. ISL-4]|nr:hypothetical protein [Bacillus sp. ISL-4]
MNFEKLGEDGQAVSGNDFFLGDFKVGGRLGYGGMDKESMNKN